MELISPSHRAPRSLITGAIALLLLLTATRAFAHARLLKSSPADKAELAQPPARVELWFNELLDDGFNTIEVYPAAELVKHEHTKLAKDIPAVDAADRTHLTINLESLQ